VERTKVQVGEELIAFEDSFQETNGFDI